MRTPSHGRLQTGMTNPPRRASVIAIRARRIACVAALVGPLTTGCAGGPTEVSLTRLAQEQDAFSGDEITTSGTVRKFEDARGSYFVLEDESRNRVALSPTSMVAGLVGEEILVTGNFEVRPGFGRVIEIERISC